MFNSSLDKSVNDVPHIQMDQLTSAEAHVIHQLRQMTLKRASYNQVVGRHEPLGHIRHEGRQYLEIREGFAPILVPSHMLDDVRAFLSNNLPEHVRRLRGNRNTPPYTPQSTAGTNALLPTAFSLDSINTSSTPQFNGSQSMSDASTPFPILDDPVSPVNPISPPFFQTPLPPASPPQASSSSDVSQLLSASLPASSNNNSLGLNMSASFTNAGFASFSMSQPSQDYSSMLPQQSVREGKVTKRPVKPPRTKKQTKRNVSTSPSNSPEGDDAFDVDAFLTTALPGYTPAIAAAIERDAKSAKNKKKGGGNTSSFSSKKSKNPAAGGLNVCDNDMEIDEEVSNALTSNQNGEVEPDERLLRKPANAFILFRTDMNKELRAKQPRLSVEAASVTIGKLWKAADAATKTKYHDKAKRARDEYFNKKRLIQSIQRLKELETINASDTQDTDDKNPASIPDAISQALAVTTTATPAAKGQLVLTTTRDLDSFSPEAIGPLSAISHSEFTSPRANQVRPTRSMTLNLDSQLLVGSSIGNSGGPLTASANVRSFISTDTGMGHGSGNRSNLGSYFNITSSTHDNLDSMFSESLTGSNVSAMAIDPAPMLLDVGSRQQSATDWITSTSAALSSSLQTIDEDNLEDVIYSLLQKN